MNANDKYKHVFGELRSLGKPRVSWTTGLSNMLEWLTWSTNDVLGVTKTKYWQQIVAWSHEASADTNGLDNTIAFVEKKLDAELSRSDQPDRYSKPTSTIAKPREALRRAKYFSEDYLNKEFDIFWALVSDPYLDAYYAQFTSIRGGGQWFTHGNSGLFACSTAISEMQMDNLSYNPTEDLLVANELKLGGKKNPDQILKYMLMLRLLRDREFISPKTRLLLLFIGDSQVEGRWDALIDEEIAFCTKPQTKTGKQKKTHIAALDPEGVKLAKSSEFDSTTWRSLMNFNASYREKLDPRTQQVEIKLLEGFNETLAAKKFMQGDLAASQFSER